MEQREFRGTPSRRLAFRRLVTLQDRGVSVENSRQQVAEEFGWTIERVRAVEEHGIKHDWDVPELAAA